MSALIASTVLFIAIFAASSASPRTLAASAERTLRRSMIAAAPNEVRPPCTPTVAAAAAVAAARFGVGVSVGVVGARRLGAGP
tara:strand:+ start:135 stop:383 length:249 start_codon:yes stop_codon:yes gene_type:complete